MNINEFNIDFMKYRKVFVWVSVALLLVAVGELLLLGDGINFGIDFKGGTQLTIRFQDEPQLDDLRRILEEAGLREAQIQRYGASGSNEVLIKTPVAGDSEEGSGGALIAAFNKVMNQEAEGSFDLNQRGRDGLADLLFAADPDALLGTGEAEARGAYAEIAASVIDAREERGLFTDWEQVRATGISEGALALIQEKTFLGAFHVLQNDNVGPQIGSELREKGVLAVVLSMIGMLIYISLRFELRFGIGAIVAAFHDFMITLGLFALFHYEFNLSTIAAFLTLVGYSVNDTVVIFDRVRENMARHRRMPMVELINVSLNQTMSRTLMTSGTTLLVVACLFYLGGEVIHGFAFVLLVGIVIGTYSSIFVASPFTLLWEQYFGKDKVREAKPRTA